MCGIAGFLGMRRLKPSAVEAIVAAMTETLRQRGPDDSGIWVDADAGIALGHRRLSIIDLGSGGHQPMATRDGRFVITYNGEIYNYREIAEQLKQAGASLRSRSDTEALVEALARWGTRETLRRCEGMFAFALWDRESRELTLARDRLGIKPLYWGHIDGTLVFGSELKALRAFGGSSPEIDRRALADYLRLGYVPSPASIYRGIYKLEPGTVLQTAAGREPRVERYWDLRQVAREARRTAPPASEAEMLAGLERLLRDAVQSEMVADVPLGAFLSGGLDSSLVAALMQAGHTRPVKTFTIGFSSGEHNEAQHAKRVAAHLGTDHTEFYVEEQSARDVIPHLPIWYDEPFADPSQIPTQIVSRLARQHVTVALSGDGGDEMFAGYTRYGLARKLDRVLRSVPRAVRRGIAAPLDAMPDSLAHALARLSSVGYRPSRLQQRLPKLAALLREDSGDAAYRRLISLWPDAGALVVGLAPACDRPADVASMEEIPDLVERIMLLDATTYLPDDVLTKVDRASMSVSLEVRVPLLNHRVVEHAWRLPLSMKLRRNSTKWALRRILYRYVPAELVDRPKHGFGVPLASWLRGALRDWAGALLSREALLRGGWLDPEAVTQRWREHLDGRCDWSASLWTVLMLQSWLAEIGNGAARPGDGDRRSLLRTATGAQ